MITNELTVALLQADLVWEDYQANINQFDQKIDQIKNADLVVLPEMFSTGFTMNPEKSAQTMAGPTVSWMREKAIVSNMDIVGSVVIEEDGCYYNRLVWCKPDEALYSYDKKHLFTYTQEHEHYHAGDSRLIVDVKGWKVAAFICFDLRFPVWSRNLNAAYDAALYIASWPEKRRAHWKALLPARAIENQCYVVGLNRVGVDGNAIAYSGDSTIIDPLGNTLYSSSYKESVHVCQLNKKELIEIRSMFPFLKEADSFTLDIN